MKKLYSTIMMLAMMVAALSLTACGGDGDDDDKGGGGNGNGNSSGDFIELTIDGKTYSKNLIGIYAGGGLTDELSMTGMTENVFKEEGFKFFLTLVHYDDMAELLSSPLITYSVGSMDENLSLNATYQKDGINYESIDGTNKVTSIKRANNGVQVCGTFNMYMKRNSNTKSIEGRYAMTVSSYHKANK